MPRISLVDAAKVAVKAHLRQGDIAIDATLGNGYDTLFLAEAVGPTGHVFGFDVQRQALASSYQKLLARDLQRRVTLFLSSHAELLEVLPERVLGKVAAVMFNLGYLPGGDKTLITRTDSTLKALAAACRLLAKSGIITVLAYPGHAGGDDETERLAEWMRRLDPDQFKTELVLSRVDKPGAPRLFILRKLADLL
ncbi:16S rRNA (cytosine(1402)-N(4))-methyltransferase [Methylomonas sp. SURF-1]|uniref:16S rRNA (Cytosine(1402)-N(4))-methyltransferase n=1 Tax=Methylomonas aurea TaxID=2952224 RepID=A0ABT1UF46_9GAMM|nr:class I SAM-dependent methyltransferase [Methylomonas sp. SURF-1]MCQ8180021.1 16S rRNA (cytosine(1402)-N(4))-methyltransferase [Methylomonas sp. SURF-1]